MHIHVCWILNKTFKKNALPISPRPAKALVFIGYMEGILGLLVVCYSRVYSMFYTKQLGWVESVKCLKHNIENTNGALLRHSSHKHDFTDFRMSDKLWWSDVHFLLFWEGESLYLVWLAGEVVNLSSFSNHKMKNEKKKRLPKKWYLDPSSEFRKVLLCYWNNEAEDVVGLE